MNGLIVANKGLWEELSIWIPIINSLTLILIHLYRGAEPNPFCLSWYFVSQGAHLLFMTARELPDFA
jgi:hypothetical protein